MAASILKVQHILRWFEEQKRFHFYASSLLFVYEGSPPPAVPLGTTGGALEPGGGHGDCGGGGGGGRGERQVVLEYNNNIEQSLSTMYALHKQACTMRHHDGVPDNGGWRHPPTVAHQPNGNRIPHALEKLSQEQENGGDGEHRNGGEDMEGSEGWGRRKTTATTTTTTTMRESTGGDDVEVRMIDFAHVFPSESSDEGYIYGLKNLIRVLQEMLEEEEEGKKKK